MILVVELSFTLYNAGNLCVYMVMVAPLNQTFYQVNSKSWWHLTCTTLKLVHGAQNWINGWILPWFESASSAATMVKTEFQA
jgi:hypothetical protein